MNKDNTPQPKEFANHQEMKQTFGDIIGLITCTRDKMYMVERAKKKFWRSLERHYVGI